MNPKASTRFSWWCAGALLSLGGCGTDSAERVAADPTLELQVHEEGAWEGYTLFSPLGSDTTYLVDMSGAEVHRWTSQHVTGGSVHLLEDGSLLRVATDDRGSRGWSLGERIEELDWDGTPRWGFVPDDRFTSVHHDLEPLPNGNLLVIASEPVSHSEAVRLGRDPAALGGGGLLLDAILEVDRSAPGPDAIVWEWHARDHLVQDRDPDSPSYGAIREHPGRIDVNADTRTLTAEEHSRQDSVIHKMRALGYIGEESASDEEERGGVSNRPSIDMLHTNSVSYHAGLDFILLSVPQFHEVWVIDHSTTSEEAATSMGGRSGKGGDLLFRWGNARAHGGDESRRLFFQHDARWLPQDDPGELRVMLFNNGAGRAGIEYSSVDVFTLPFDPVRGFIRDSSGAFERAQLTWTYSDPGSFFSNFMSGAERLPNGNTLVCSGVQSRIFEVTPGGDIVWDYGSSGETPAAAGHRPLFRATRVSPEHPAAQRLR